MLQLGNHRDIALPERKPITVVTTATWGFGMKLQQPLEVLDFAMVGAPGLEPGTR
jgi:hypothetical protein